MSPAVDAHDKGHSAGRFMFEGLASPAAPAAAAFFVDEFVDLLHTRFYAFALVVISGVSASSQFELLPCEYWATQLEIVFGQSDMRFDHRSGALLCLRQQLEITRLGTAPEGVLTQHRARR